MRDKVRSECVADRQMVSTKVRPEPAAQWRGMRRWTAAAMSAQKDEGRDKELRRIAKEGNGQRDRVQAM